MGCPEVLEAVKYILCPFELKELPHPATSHKIEIESASKASSLLISPIFFHIIFLFSK
jgi:hypothetical protein